MSRRRRGEARVVFPWERRSAVLDWLTSRRRRTLVAAAFAVFCVWAFAQVEDRRRRVFATRAAIASVRRAAEAFRADHGRCPGSLDELVRPPAVAEAHGHYLLEARLDGWGRALRMTCPGRNHPSGVDVVSGGSTGTFEDLERIY